MNSVTEYTLVMSLINFLPVIRRCLKGVQEISFYLLLIVILIVTCFKYLLASFWDNLLLFSVSPFDILFYFL